MTTHRTRSGRASSVTAEAVIGNVRRTFKEPVGVGPLEAVEIMKAEARLEIRVAEARLAVLRAPKVADFADYWIETRYCKGHMGRRPAARSTIKQVTGHLSNHVLPWIGGGRMDEVTLADLHRVFAKCHESDATKNRIRTTLQAMFKDATRHGMNGWVLQRDVAAGLAPWIEVREPREALRPEEFQPFLRALAGRRSQPIVAVMLLSGGERLREVLDLTADRVILDVRCAPAAGALFWRPYQTKERRFKEVPIPHELVPYIQAPLAAARAWHPEAKLWPDLAEKTVEADCAEACRALGLDRHVTPHGLRHSFAQALDAAGVDEYEIRDLLGHRDVKVTAGYLAGRRRRVDARDVVATHAAGMAPHLKVVS